MRNENGECVCPPGTALNQEDECRRCIIELGYKIDERGRCVCALDRGFIIDERGRCICPIEHGYSLNNFGQCVPSALTTYNYYDNLLLSLIFIFYNNKINKFFFQKIQPNSEQISLDRTWSSHVYRTEYK